MIITTVKRISSFYGLWKKIVYNVLLRLFSILNILKFIDIHRNYYLFKDIYKRIRALIGHLIRGIIICIKVKESDFCEIFHLILQQVMQIIRN